MTPAEPESCPDNELHRVRNLMTELAAEEIDPNTRIAAAVRYHLSASGKQVRARLALSCAQALSIDPDDANALAACCEFLHNASLVHDDLQDRDPSRRGQPALWTRFDRDTALLVGDLFLSLSFRALAEVRIAAESRHLMRLLHQRTSQAIAGQSLDLGQEIHDLNCYEVMVGGKSGAFLSLPLEMPLILARRDQDLATARQGANAFAIGYQIADDLADLDDRTLRGSNLVAILEKHHGRDRAIALSKVRAELAFAEAIDLANLLPSGCAALLGDYAAMMLANLHCRRAA